MRAADPDPSYLIMARPDDLPDVPIAERYKRALTSMRVAHAVTPKQRLMLMRH